MKKTEVENLVALSLNVELASPTVNTRKVGIALLCMVMGLL